MKRKISIILVITLGLLVALPSAGYSWRHYGHHGYYRHGYYNGWAPAAIIAGGIITGAVLVSALSARPYYYPQQAVYVNPAPVAYYPPVNQPYASPDPNFVAQYSKNNPSGEWVTIPGQQVGDKWVPAHKVFVPSKP